MREAPRQKTRATVRSRSRASRTCALHCALLMAALPNFGCGGDDDPKPAANSGAGGSAGTSNHSGAGRGGSAEGPAPVECGAKMCAPAASPLSGLLDAVPALGSALPTPMACCFDAQSGACGMRGMPTATCERPAVADARCPGVDLGGLGAFAGALGGATMVGCCMENRCGLDGALFGRGCVENNEARIQLSGIPLLGTLANIPPSLACDRPTESEQDAGTGNDAGL